MGIFTYSDGSLRAWAIVVGVLAVIAVAVVSIAAIMDWQRDASIRDTGSAYHPDVFDDVDAGVRCYHVDHGTTGTISCVKIR